MKLKRSAAMAAVSRMGQMTDQDLVAEALDITRGLTMKLPTADHLRAVFELLYQAKQHLEYTGYGDAWERECSEELRKALDSLPEVL